MTTEKCQLVLCAAVSLVGLVLVGNASADSIYPVDESMLLDSYVHDDQKETALLVLSWQRSGSGSFMNILLRNNYGMSHELLNP